MAAVSYARTRVARDLADAIADSVRRIAAGSSRPAPPSAARYFAEAAAAPSAVLAYVVRRVRTAARGARGGAIAEAPVVAEVGSASRRGGSVMSLPTASPRAKRKAA